MTEPSAGETATPTGSVSSGGGTTTVKVVAAFSELVATLPALSRTFTRTTYVPGTKSTSANVHSPVDSSNSTGRRLPADDEVKSLPFQNKFGDTPTERTWANTRLTPESSSEATPDTSYTPTSMVEPSAGAVATPTGSVSSGATTVKAVAGFSELVATLPALSRTFTRTT